MSEKQGQGGQGAGWDFRALLEGHSAMMFLVDRDSMAILDANRACEQFYGYSRVEFLQLNVTDLNTLNRAELEQEFDRARAEGRHYYTFKHRLKNGELRDVEVRSHPFSMADGRAVYFAIVHDITQRTRNQAELKASEERYRWLVDNIREGIALIKDRRMVYTNPSAERIIGYTPSELAEMDFSELISLEDRELVSNYRARRLKGEPMPETYEVRVFHKDGSLRWVEISGVAIDLDGQPATLNFITDITQRKRAEEERVHRERLQAAVVTAGAACHELNQPLQGVLSHLELMLMRVGDQPELAREVGRILDQTRQMAEITQRLSRITDFRTRRYLDQSEILDLEGSAPKAGGQ
ncbi:MAG: PAS domain S-box protein [Pseudomonadota bacterium]